MCKAYQPRAVCAAIFVFCGRAIFARHLIQINKQKKRLIKLFGAVTFRDAWAARKPGQRMEGAWGGAFPMTLCEGWDGCRMWLWMEIGSGSLS
jgi:hypothetical protein